MKKRILSLLMALLTVAGMAAASVSAADAELPFKDVKKKKWFYSAVEYVYTNGIMNGTSKTLFEPQTPVTRAMFVAMLGRLHGAEETKSSFKDIPAKNSSWYSGYVGWASDNGIVTGFPDNTFRPDDKLTREQMATIISRYIDYAGILTTISTEPTAYFKDEKSIGKWAREYVDDMRTIGIVEGDELGRFNPSANLTRAEAATTVKRLDEMIKKLALGDAERLDYTVSDKLVLMGAWQLYYSGTALDSGYSGVTVKTDEEYPYLTNDPDGQLFRYGDYRYGEDFGTSVDPNPLLEGNYFEIDLNVASIDISKYHAVRFAYRTSDAAPVRVGLYGKDAKLVEAIEGEEAVADWKYAICDLDTESVDTVSIISTGDIELLYFAAATSLDEAKGFKASEHGEYLSKYSGETVEISDADDAALDAVYNEAAAKADSIINCDDGITPSDIKGTAYYISSINGDDSNDGKSPDRPWKTFTGLWKSVAGGRVTLSTLSDGDGVFLERGSEFNCNSSEKLDYLDIVKGMTYGAYGEGEKPVITAKLQMDSPSGTWTATEYPNVWALDCDITDSPGNISFVKKDGTVLWGIMTFVEDYNDPFGGKTRYYGIVSNGEEVFESGGVEFNSVGDLRHNLEYFGDKVNGGLYVYYDKGNPGEVFAEINISLSTSLVGNNGELNASSTLPTRFDNIALKYAGCHGLDIGSTEGLYVTNCVFEWIGGAYQGTNVRYGNAIQNWGSCDGIVVKNCYFKDIYDAAVTTQGYSGVMRNFYSEGCVLERCGLSFEFFNHASSDYDSLYPNPELSNVFICDNYVLDAGFGFCDVRTDRRAAFVYSAYGVTRARYDNFVYSGNVNVCSAEYALYTTMLACGKTEGTQLYNNTYYMDSTDSFYGRLIYNISDRTGDAVLYPYTSQYLTYLRALGIEDGSTFYSVKNPNIDASRP